MSPLHLLLLLIVFLFSHPCFSAVTITHLPGFSGSLPFHLETGYVSVDEVNGVELFYYFIESERNPSEDPLLLWLTGGPGCSAISGLAFEIGPLNFVIADYNGSLPSLVYNPYSWTKNANVIFVDSPVGSGFSFSRNPNGYVVDEASSLKQVYEFLRKWFIEHPHFLSNHLYIAGDSYAGKLIPIVAHQIDEGIQAGNQPFLNLKGYLVGNPLTGEAADFNSRVEYAQRIGIISDELYEVIQRECQGEDYAYPDPHKYLCISALDEFNMLRSEIEESYTPDLKCPADFNPEAIDMTRHRSLMENKYLELNLPPLLPDIHCRTYPYFLSYFWANNNETREALHIKKGTIAEWVRCNSSLSYTMNIPSSVMYHLNVTKKGYRALVYSSDKDMYVPFFSTQAWIRSFNFTIVDDWRSWHVNGQVAGYTRKYSNDLTFATVKDAGHTAPMYKPENCWMMFSRWISHSPL